MTAAIFQDIKGSLRQLYLEDERPWLVGFSGGKDSTMLASLVFEVVLSIQARQRKKPVSVLCTDTRVEIPAIAEMVEGTLDRMRRCSQAARTQHRRQFAEANNRGILLGQHHRSWLSAAQPHLPVVHAAFYA